MRYTYISARHKGLDFKLKEVWQYRDLIFLFTRRNFLASYTQTILGPLWLLLAPLLTALMH